MERTSRVANKNVAVGSWRGSRTRHSLLLQMAQDAEKLAGQAERLMGLKKLARVTNRQIGDAVGVTERQVQRWLAGGSDIEPQNLKKVAAYFGTTPDYVEYGTVVRERNPTPKLDDALGADDVPTRLTRIEQRLDQIQTLLTTLAEEGLLASIQAAQQEGEPGDEADRQRAA